ncbi:MAG TPA: AAA family ATPase [Panacibacter sp.]|nr:AAA family ATPase [Panacibacter sp.]HNP44590.1 AAA family ATPase [Panacibacter sp.]
MIIGPESTGKSTLCQTLATHYNTLWCPEFARDYLTKNGMDYSYDDLLGIAKGQLELEEQYASALKAQQKEKETNSVLFLDTDMYVMKVWCEYVFGKCHQFILDQIAIRKYDLYLLCNIDLPWVYDPLREYPDEKPRVELYQVYKDLLVNQSTPWVTINGSYAERLTVAIKAVDELLNK